jgi:hypothetical protein
MTTTVLTQMSVPKLGVKKIALGALTVLVALSLALNVYYYAAISSINGDLTEAGFVEEASSMSMLDRLEVTVLSDNVRTVAISAAQAATAVQELQAALVEAQAAMAAAAAQ